MGFMNSTFPVAVYGLQDAFSQCILYLKLRTTNSHPKLIGRWHMDHLYGTKGNLSCFNNICIQIVIQLKRALISTLSGIHKSIRSLSWLFIKMTAFIGAWNKKMDLLRASAYGKNIVIITGNFQYFLVKFWICFPFCSQY